MQDRPQEHATDCNSMQDHPASGAPPGCSGETCSLSGETKAPTATATRASCHEVRHNWRSLPHAACLLPRGATQLAEPATLPPACEQWGCPEARCPAPRMLVNAREWRNNASWSSVAYTTSGSKAMSNARWPGRSLAFKTRWRMCFSYKSLTFICFHANFSSFSFVDRQNAYSCKSDLFAN